MSKKKKKLSPEEMDELIRTGKDLTVRLLDPEEISNAQNLSLAKTKVKQGEKYFNLKRFNDAERESLEGLAIYKKLS